MVLTIKSFLLVIHNCIRNITLLFCVEDEFIGVVRPTILVHHADFYGIAASPAELQVPSVMDMTITYLLRLLIL